MMTSDVGQKQGVERRVDPVDGVACTWEELQPKYKGIYTAQELNVYWDEQMVRGATGLEAAQAASASQAPIFLGTSPSPLAAGAARGIGNALQDYSKPASMASPRGPRLLPGKGTPRVEGKGETQTPQQSSSAGGFDLRIDPFDGARETWNNLQSKYEDQKSLAEMKDYWEKTMTLAAGGDSKASGDRQTSPFGLPAASPPSASPPVNRALGWRDGSFSGSPPAMMGVGNRVGAELEKLEPVFEKLKPFFKRIRPLLRAAVPLGAAAVAQVGKAQKTLSTHYTEEVGEILTGSVLLFFGSQFAMTIACVQAFRISGSERMQESFRQLQENYRRARLALNKDPEARRMLDRDNDGEVSRSELMLIWKELVFAESKDERKEALQKAFLVLKCVDPNRALEALVRLWGGCTMVLAVLRSRFAYCVSQGANVGQLLCATLRNYAQEPLYKMLPEHKPWVDFGLRFSSGLVGIVISRLLFRVLSAYSSALQGSAMLTAAVLRIRENRAAEQLSAGARQKRIVDTNINGVVAPEEIGASPWARPRSRSDGEEGLAPMLDPKVELQKLRNVEANKKEITKYALALCGFVWQLTGGRNLPLLLKILLSPVRVVEHSLTLMVNW